MGKQNKNVEILQVSVVIALSQEFTCRLLVYIRSRQV